MRFGKRHLSLRTSIALLVCSVVIAVLAVTGVMIGIREMNNTQAGLAQKAMAIAQVVADTPVVINALEGKVKQADVQAFTNKLLRDKEVRFIVVMNMNGIRLSHPDPRLIGKHFVGGDEQPALHGKTYISFGKGTLGTSMRAFVPIRNAQGKEIGAVAVGIMMRNVRAAIARGELVIYIGIAVGLTVGILGALALATSIKRILFGLEPIQIAGLLQERSAMLESVREGILAIDRAGAIIIANSEAVRMFRSAGLDGNPLGEDADAYLPGFGLGNVLQRGISEYDQEYRMNGITFVANRVPVRVDKKVVGAIATFRDKTDLRQLAEQLTGVKHYADALRVQSHEFMNKLHVILGMIHSEQYQELSTYIERITEHFQIEVGSVSRLVKDPIFAGFLLSKLSYAREHNVQLNINGKGTVPPANDPETSDQVITIVGNLIDNSFEAMQSVSESERQIDLMVQYAAQRLHLSVSDSGVGIPPELVERIFDKGFSTKGNSHGYGLYLVRKTLNDCGGTIDLQSAPHRTTFLVEMPYQGK